MANIINTIEARLPAISGKVLSNNLDIASEVQQASDFWQNKKETSAGAEAELTKYWESVGWNRSQWSASGTPWSAAFVSYILRDQDFPAQSSHFMYTLDAEKGAGGWSAFSIPKNKDKLVVSVGDVLVKPRSGGDTNAHGDVVYAIQDGAAGLVGGNLSDSVGFVTIGLNPDGTIRDAKDYLVLLKKNPISSFSYYSKKVLFWGGISLLLGAGAFIGYRYYKGLPMLPSMKFNPLPPPPPLPPRKYGSKPPVLLAEQELERRNYENIDYKGEGRDTINGETFSIHVFNGTKDGVRYILRVARENYSDRIVVRAIHLFAQNKNM